MDVDVDVQECMRMGVGVGVGRSRLGVAAGGARLTEVVLPSSAVVAAVTRHTPAHDLPPFSATLLFARTTSSPNWRTAVGQRRHRWGTL